MASTYLTRTFQSGGNTAKWTFSAWIKKCAITNNDDTIFSRYQSADYYTTVAFGSDRLFFTQRHAGTNVGYLETDQHFRDVNGWYHFVFVWDSGNVTANNRMRIYVNGSEITSFSTRTNPSQDLGSTWNTAHPMEIGRHNSGNYFNGYMSHVHFCDGYAYSPTDFGETDSNGVWSIKTSPSVSYGTTGFLILKDGNTITDQSSNSNAWTLSGGTLTDMQDCPDNVFATMNPLDNYEQGSTFTIGNNKVEWNTDNKTNYANFAINKGKYYWEMKFANNTGGDYGMIGISVEDYRQPDDYPGHDSTGWSYYASSGNKYNNGGGSYGDSWTVNDIIGVAFDADTRTLWFSKNGVWQNSATISEIAAGTTTNAAWTGMGSAGDWFIPCMSGYDGNKAEFNFGNGYFSTTQITDEGTNASGIGKFEYDVPNNFTALCTKGLNN